MRCDTLNEKNVRVCASGAVFCVHTPSRSGQLPLSGREMQKKKTTTHQQLRLLNCWKMYKKFKTAVRLSDQFPGACIDFIENASRCCLTFTTLRTSNRLANCADATSANSESMKMNPTMLSLVTSRKKRMVAVDVLLPRLVLGHSRYYCSEGLI